MSRRVYVPNKAHGLLTEAAKLLYLLKTAMDTESKEQLHDRVDKIRALVLESSESID